MKCEECIYYNTGDGCELSICEYEDEKLYTELVCYKEKITDTERFEKITNDMLELYKIKNKNYGGSFSEQFKEYGLTSVCIRLDDKIRRLKNLAKQGDSAKVYDESIIDTLIDISVYSVLSIMEINKKEGY